MDETVAQSLSLASREPGMYPGWTGAHRNRFKLVVRRHKMENFNLSHFFVQRRGTRRVALTEGWRPNQTVVLPTADYQELATTCLALPTIISNMHTQSRLAASLADASASA